MYPVNLLALFMLISSILTSTVQAEEIDDSEPIVVRLETEKQLIPLYITRFYQQNPGFDASYIQALENVLLFDLNHSGMTYTLKPTPEAQALAGAFEETGNLLGWNALKVFYVIKGLVQNKMLTINMISVHGSTIKTATGIALTGNLNQDRRVIHQLADLIHKTLFDIEGIALTHLLFSVRTRQENNENWTSEIWESDYDGANARQVTYNAGYCITPVYIPAKEGANCGSFFYVSYQSGQSKIYAASLKNGMPQRLNYMRGNQLMPTISRQRDKIAFISDFTGNPDLFLQPFSPETGAIDKPHQIYSTHKATQGTPTFSPEGNRVAFVSNKDGSPRIYAMEIPPPGAHIKDVKAYLISKYNRENSAPAWSPDGTKLAYCSMSDGVRQIWMYDFNTHQERQLTQGPGNKENPAWAPNSLHLVFNSTGPNGSELYLINLNQTQAEKISTGIMGEKRFPNWEPRG